MMARSTATGERLPFLRSRAGAWRALVVLTAAGVVLAGMAWVWVMNPPATAVGQVARADAVVMFAGGRGERLTLAQRLARDGRAPVLVIPNGTARQWPAANRLCSGQPPVGPVPAPLEGIEVLCPRPSPNTTRGEARIIAQLARERGWNRVIAVTSDYHLRRAELLLDRCFEGEIVAVAATPRIGVLSRVRVVVHEWGGHLQARLLQRRC